MSECARPQRLFVGGVALALRRVGRDGFRHGVVEALIEGVKLVGRDRFLRLLGELGHRLAHVTVIVNDLGDGKALLQQLAPVHRRADLDGTCRLGGRWRGRLERRRELIEKQRNALRQLDLRLASASTPVGLTFARVRAMSSARPGGNELVQHETLADATEACQAERYEQCTERATHDDERANVVGDSGVICVSGAHVADGHMSQRAT